MSNTFGVMPGANLGLMPGPQGVQALSSTPIAGTMLPSAAAPMTANFSPTAPVLTNLPTNFPQNAQFVPASLPPSQLASVAPAQAMPMSAAPMPLSAPQSMSPVPAVPPDPGQQIAQEQQTAMQQLNIQSAVGQLAQTETAIWAQAVQTRETIEQTREGATMTMAQEAISTSQQEIDDQIKQAKKSLSNSSDAV